MTACVNNEKEIKGGVSHKVLRSVVAGVLAVSMVPTAAFAAEPEGASADVLATAPSASNWKGVEFTWNAEADKWGNYSVPAGDPFYVTSAVDVLGQAVSASDYQVVYVEANASGSLNTSADSTDDNTLKVYAETPSTPDGYVAVLLEGAVVAKDAIGNGTTFSSLIVDANGDGTAETSLKAYMRDNDSKVQTQAFSVTPLSFEGAFAYKGDDVEDTSFKAGTLTDGDLAFADADGNEIADSNYDVTLLDSSGAAVTSGSILQAGDYTAVLKGANSTPYEGSYEEVAVKVDAIDPSVDTFTVKPILSSQVDDAFGASGAVLSQSKWDGVESASVEDFGVYVNDELLVSTSNSGNTDEDNAVEATAKSIVGADGTVTSITNAVSDISTKLGKVNLEISDGTADIIDGDTASASVLVVTSDVAFTYAGDPVADMRVVTADGERFNPGRIAAEVAGAEVPFDLAVTKGGEPVESYDEPGVYKVVLTAEAPANSYAYAGYASFEVEVVATELSDQPVVYAVLDGADADGATPEYDGEAVVPTIVAKDGKTVLTEGEDYTVSVADEKGNAVESAVEPGKYTWTVDFMDAPIKGGGTADNVEFTVEITKAELESAEADEPVYAYTGEPVSPTFTAWTDKGCKGLSVEIDPAKTGVTYYKAVVDPKTGEPAVVGYNAAGEVAANATDKTVAFTGWEYDDSQKLSASDVKDEGFYVAFVTAPADDPHFQGTAVQAAQFEVSEYAKYEDVDASEWYATPVYQARDLGYMTGVAGTKLFMPGADVSREQVASVLFRMAGEDDGQNPALPYFPTRFSDVDGWAWYAEAVSWAAQAGVMNGYAGTDVFGVSEDATREELACIFYNYARSQGKDVSVDDADAALAAYADGDEVSEWAKTAVAWAIENGVMGNGGIERFRPQDPISRAEVAAMAVNFQPEALK